MSIPSNFSAQRSPNQGPASISWRTTSWSIAMATKRLEAEKFPCKEENSKLEKSTFVGFVEVFGGFQGSGKINPSGIHLQQPSSGQNPIIIMLLLGSKPYRCQCWWTKLQPTYWHDFSLIQYFRHQQHDDCTGLHNIYIYIYMYVYRLYCM